jgi:hypothetical protein
MADGAYRNPRAFRLMNVAEKATTYMMAAIPPIIPDDRDNDFHARLIERGMAIAVGADGVLPALDQPALAAMRERIIANADLFTFDGTFRLIDRLVAQAEAAS